LAKPAAEQVVVVHDEHTHPRVLRLLDCPERLPHGLPPGRWQSAESLVEPEEARQWSVIVTVLQPQARACARVGNQRSMRKPVIPGPVSAATPSPYPGIARRVPSGITVGSSATTPCATGSPVAVVPGKE